MVNFSEMIDLRSNWRLKQRALTALGVLSIASGVYLLIEGAYQIASLSVISANNLQFIDIIEVLFGSILTWVGSASIAESRQVTVIHAINHRGGERVCTEDASSSTQESQNTGKSKAG